MIIILGIIGGFASILGSATIIINASLNSVLEIPKRGYKINIDILNDYQVNLLKEKMSKSSILKTLLESIILLIPGINLLYATISYVKAREYKKLIMNNPKIKENIIPMTDIEKEQYSKTKGKIQKLAFATLNISNKNDIKENCDKKNSFNSQNNNNEKKIISLLNNNNELKPDTKYLQKQSEISLDDINFKIEEKNFEEYPKKYSEHILKKTYKKSK